MEQFLEVQTTVTIHEQVSHSFMSTAQNPSSVFEQVGPLVDDWENHVNSFADSLEHHSKHEEPTPYNKDLFQQDNNSTHEQLDRDMPSTIALLCFKLATHHISALKDLKRQSFWIDLMISRKISDIPELTSEPTLYPYLKDIMNCHTLLRSVNLVARTGELITPQEFKTKESSVQRGTHARMSDLLEGRLPGKSIPTLRPPLIQLYHNKKKSVCPGVAELEQQVTVTKEMYTWILNITPSNLNMNFQEVLVDLTTKNEHGLYEARIKARVGGHLLHFYSLIGLENDSLYRTMPRIIALALEALKKLKL